MKKLAIILAAAAMMFVTGCKKDNGGSGTATEVGKWYAYNVLEGGTVDKNDVAFVLELKADKTADFMICAWGSRWQGTYTYDGKVVKLQYNKFLFRGNAAELGHNSVDPAHLYEWWNSYDLNNPPQDVFQRPDDFGQVIEIGFTYSGNNGTINMANKPCPAERQ